MKLLVGESHGSFHVSCHMTPHRLALATGSQEETPQADEGGGTAATAAAAAGGSAVPLLTRHDAKYEVAQVVAAGGVADVRVAVAGLQRLQVSWGAGFWGVLAGTVPKTLHHKSVAPVFSGDLGFGGASGDSVRRPQPKGPTRLCCLHGPFGFNCI